MKSKHALPPERKRLLICRHAKSSWQDATLSDSARPLNKRGERDAPIMGRRLACRGIRPDLLLSSPAERARSTALHYAAELGYPLENIQLHPDLYAATVPRLLSLLQAFEPQSATVLLMGHNPELTALANMLGGIQIDNIPTSGIVALDFSIASWRELEAGKGRLLFFDFPKKQD